MLRQIHIFHNSERIYNFTYAMALGDEELERVKGTIKSYLDMPMPGKTFQRPLGDFQIFHSSIDSTLFLLIVDLVDNREHVEVILNKIINRFKEIFPRTEDFNKGGEKIAKFEIYLRDLQYELHSKIVIIGPIKAGKTTLYNLLRANQEKDIMNFAKSSIFKIDTLKFDIWDFQLKDNYSLLWSKFINGADLVILLFDLSNYHLRVIKHFLDLHHNEGKMSKLIIIGNKRDLVEEEDIKLIKNELGMQDFKEISLKDLNAKEEITQLISSKIRLKKSLPSNFDKLREEAERVKNEGNLILAISKYRELISICNNYQDFTHIQNFKDNLKDLQKKVENEKKKRRELESKKKFEIPGQIKFTKKVTVKPLPKDKSEINLEMTPPPARPSTVEEKTSSKESKVGKLTLFKKTEKEEKLEKTKKPKLRSKDFEIKSQVSPSVPSTKVEKEATSPSNFPKKLQELIEKKGSSLNLKLCKHLISELKTTLDRPLTLEDIENAATIFIKQENL